MPTSGTSTFGAFSTGMSFTASLGTRVVLAQAFFPRFLLGLPRAVASLDLVDEKVLRPTDALIGQIQARIALVGILLGEAHREVSGSCEPARCAARLRCS